MQPTDEDLRRSSVCSPLPDEVSLQMRRLRDREISVRAAAAKALGKSGQAEAVAPLVGALQDEEMQVRFCAAWALWHLADVRAVEPLCAALGDSVSDVRSAAAFALGRLGDVRAVEPLCGIVKGNDRPVRYAAAVALWEIGNEKTMPLRLLSVATLTPAQKLRALEALSGITYVIGGRDARAQVISYPFGGVRFLCEKLCRQADTEPPVREGAEAVLGELRNRTDALILLRAIGREETRERQELLRSVSGGSEPTLPDELLRPSGLSPASTPAPRPTFLTRIFRRR